MTDSMFEKCDVALAMYTMTVRGQTTPFATFAAPEVENHENVGAAIKSALRIDREEHVSNAHGCHPNPSLPAEPTYINDSRQLGKIRLYSNLPGEVRGHQLIDAFMCLGSRFGLTPVLVYVELHKSGYKYWVEIYYACDADQPATMIDIQRIVISFTQSQVEAALERSYKMDEQTAQRIAEFESEA